MQPNSSLLYLPRDRVSDLGENDKDEFLQVLKRFVVVRQRQKKNWAKRTRHLDQHIKQLPTATELVNQRAETDSDPTPADATQFVDMLSGSSQKPLIPEAIEAVKARLCMMDFSTDENAIDPRRPGVYMVMSGVFRGVLHSKPTDGGETSASGSTTSASGGGPPRSFLDDIKNAASPLMNQSSYARSDPLASTLSPGCDCPSVSRFVMWFHFNN